MLPQNPQRRALVLGASSDIGLAVCRRYLAEGYDVVAHYGSNRDAIKSVSGPNVTAVRCDLSDLEQVDEFAKTDEVLSSDVLICLAARASLSSLEACDPASLIASMNVGALSNYLVMGSLGPVMASRGWGRIVIGSSIGVVFGGGTDSFSYALANHTSEFLPQATRAWASKGVLTNVIRIGVTDTKLHSAFPERSLAKRTALIPLRRPATVGEIADYIFWHGSDHNTYVSGQLLAISGGE